jgi:hypothetical protein
VDAEPRLAADDPRDMSPQFGLVANQYQFQVGKLVEAIFRRPHGDLGAKIAAHGIN